MLDRNGTEKDHPFYETALNTLIGRVDIMQCQERQMSDADFEARDLIPDFDE